MRDARIAEFWQSREPRYRLLWRRLNTVARARLDLTYDVPLRSLRRWIDGYAPHGPSLTVDSDVRSEFAWLQAAQDAFEGPREGGHPVPSDAANEDTQSEPGAAVRDAPDADTPKVGQPMESPTYSGPEPGSSRPTVPVTPPARDAFVSYSHEDKSVARRLVDELAHHGISCWIDEGELLIGDSLVERIGEAIEKAEFLIAVVSKHSVDSRWCRQELSQAAVEELEASSGVKVLPVRVGDVQMPHNLKGRLWGPDLRDSPKDAAQQLAKSIRGHRGRKSASALATPSETESLILGLPSPTIIAGTQPDPLEGHDPRVDRHRASRAPSRISDPTRVAVSSLVAAAAIQLVADQFEDGAWARSLRRHTLGAKFTDDVGEAMRLAPDLAATTSPPERRAISVTAWAAVALSQTFGAKAGFLVAPSAEYVMRHYDDATGSFGFVHARASSTPLVAPHQGFHPNPRHTASAIKLLYHTGRHPRAMARALGFLLLRSQNDDGSWSESLPDAGNTLTTAYVLDAMLTVRGDVATFGAALDRTELRAIEKHFDIGLSAGMDWLARQQSTSDGSWGYRLHGDDPTMRPFYTAHIVSYLPQLLTRYPTVLDGALQYLRERCVEGGFPETTGGPPALAPTAMVAGGLRRIDVPQARPISEDALAFLAGTVIGDEVPKLHVFASSFILLLGQFDDVFASAARDATWQAIKRLAEAQRNGYEDDRVVDLALRGFSHAPSGLREALYRILRGDP